MKKNILSIILIILVLFLSMNKKGGKKKYAPNNCSHQQSPINISQISNNRCGPPRGMNLCSFHIHDNAEHKGINCSNKKNIKEAHWVYTSCPVNNVNDPQWGLKNCVPSGCSNPKIHVVGAHLNMNGTKKSKITRTGAPLNDLFCYDGSTTSASYNNSCSKIPVNWHVKNTCIPVSNKNYEKLTYPNNLSSSRNINKYGPLR